MKLTLIKDLVPVKQAARAEIDRCAGEARSRYITTVPGQSDTYRAKEAEARAYVSAKQRVPYLAAEAALRGITVMELARLVISTAESTQKSLIEIETVRQKAKLDINEANTPAQIEVILKGCKTWMET